MEIQKRHTIIIGAGSGGLTVAIGLANMGRQVTLIEGGDMGGECTNSGCVPSKALLHAAVEEMPGKQAMKYVQDTIQHIRAEESVEILESYGIEVIRGWASFADEHTVRISSKPSNSRHPDLSAKSEDEATTSEGASLTTKHQDPSQMLRVDQDDDSISSSHSPNGIALSPTPRNDDEAVGSPNLETRNLKPETLHLSAKHIVIATGSLPLTIDIPGLPADKTFTNQNIFELKDVPKKLAIVGAGPIGCELASAFARLGTEVHLLYRGDRILKNTEPEAALLIQNSLESQGVTFHFNADEYRWEKGGLVFSRSDHHSDLSAELEDGGSVQLAETSEESSSRKRSFSTLHVDQDDASPQPNDTDLLPECNEETDLLPKRNEETDLLPKRNEHTSFLPERNEVESKGTGLVQAFDSEDSAQAGIQKAETSTIPNLDGVLLSLGRVPNIAGLNLQNANITHTKSGITTNSRYQTNQSHIYAIGDCIDAPKFTHLANAQGRSVVRSIAFPWLPGGGVKSSLPAVTFTSPEIATVGLTLDQLNNYPPPLLTKLKVDLSLTDRGKTDQLTPSLLIIHAHRLTGRVLRATIVAPHAGEMLGYWSLAIDHKLSLWKLYGTMLPYPTVALGFKKASDQFMAQTLTNLKSEILTVAPTMLGQWFKKWGPRLVAIIFWLTLVVGIRRYMATHDMTIAQVMDALAVFLAASSVGVLVYLVLYFFRFLILFPALMLALLAGFAYGPVYGFIYGLIGGTISTIIPFWTGKWFTDNKSEPKFTQFTSLGSVMQHNPFRSVFISRILLLPYDAINLLAGHLQISFWTFFIATMIGNLAGTLFYVTLGASFQGSSFESILAGDISIDYRLLLTSAVIFALVMTGAQVVKRLQK